MNLKHEVNQIMLKIKIDSRNLEEMTSQHQSMLQSYKDDMKKYDMKVADCVYKVDHANSIVEKLAKDLVTKSEINPKIAKIERDINTLLVKATKDKEVAEKLEQYDELEKDIFVTEQPAYSKTNHNIISFLKSIYYPIKAVSDSENLEILKAEIRDKIEKFEELPLTCEEKSKQEMELMQKESALLELKLLLETQVSLANKKMLELLSNANASSAKSKWKKISTKISKSSRRASKLTNVIMSAFKMSINKADTNLTKAGNQTTLLPNKRELDSSSPNLGIDSPKRPDTLSKYLGIRLNI